MGYQVSDIKIYREADFNVAPETKKIQLIKNSSFDLSAEQKSEVVDLLGNGYEPNAKTYGSYSYSGSLGFVLSADYMALLTEGVIGTASDVADATADDWAADTSYAVGDIVNHSDDEHSLVCYKAGTSGSDEPTVDGKKDGETVTDNEVTWFVRPKLYRRSGTLQSCLPSFAVERKDIANCTAGDDHFELFTGVIMSNLEVKKEGGEIKFDISESVNALGFDNSFSNSDYEALGDGTEVSEFFYNEEDLEIEVEIDGTYEKLSGIDSINLNIQREVEVIDTAEGKRPKFKKTTISGNAKGLINAELYETSFLKKVRPVRFIYSKANGDKTIISFSKVEFGNSKNSITVGEDIMLDIELNAFGTKDVSSVSYECVTTLDI